MELLKYLADVTDSIIAHAEKNIHRTSGCSKFRENIGTA